MKRSFWGLLALVCVLVGVPVRPAHAADAGSVTGLVRDTADRVVEGAEVRLIRNGVPVGLARSDRNGRYLFPDVAVGEFGITANSPGLNRGEQFPIFVRSRVRTRVDFALPPLAVPLGGITGTVIGPGGQLVAGARVEVMEGPTDGRATSDRVGRFRLPALLAGSYNLSVTTDNLATRFQLQVVVLNNVITDIRVDLVARNELAPGGYFGMVKDEVGQPIPNVRIETTSGFSVASTFSGETGRYGFLGLVPDLYTFRASAPGFESSSWEQVLVSPGQEVRVDFALRRVPGAFGEVAGTVRDRQGRALAGAKVEVVSGPTLRVGVTDLEGKYRLRELAPGNYVLRASRVEYRNQSRATPVAGGLIRTVDFTLEKDLSGFSRVFGRVRDSRGVLIFDAKVRIVEGPTLREVATNVNGFYELGDLPSGNYRFLVTKEGFLPAEAQVALANGLTRELNFTLRSNLGELRGTVRGSLGESLTGVRVEIVVGPATGRFTFTSLGAYRFEQLPAGTYTVRFTRAGYRLLEVSNVRIEGGAVVTRNVTLQRVQ